VTIGGAEAKRVAEALRDAVWGAGLSIREVNRRLKRSSNYLNQVMAGRIELKVGTIVQVLEVIGKAPSEFWTEIGSTEKLVEKKAVPHWRPRGPMWPKSEGPQDQPVTRGELRQMFMALGERIDSGGVVKKEDLAVVFERVLESKADEASDTKPKRKRKP
jgi:plasmid maintenance system antidote protein VapI